MKKYVICCFFVVNISPTSISEFSFMLKPSAIEGIGVGVFATHDIEAGTIIDASGIPVRILHKDEIPLVFLKYCVALGGGFYRCPDCFSKMAIFWYLNHSNSHNLDWIDTGVFRTNKDIKQFEELLMNYNQLDEPENEKEEFYKRLQ